MQANTNAQHAEKESVEKQTISKLHAAVFQLFVKQGVIKAHGKWLANPDKGLVGLHTPFLCLGLYSSSLLQM